MNIDVVGASWIAEGRRIVDSIDLAASSGEFIGLIGPNGSGKSSLLRVIYRLYPLNTGVVYLGGQNLWKLSAKDTARRMAVVSQEHVSDFDFTVEEIVFMGRTPHKRWLEGDNPADDEIVYDALAHVGMLSFVSRSFSTLSGGEKQRVLIARALAQHAQILILDEPTNHLDIRFQMEILDLVRSLKVTTIVALHDLNLAAAYCDRIYLLKEGRIVTHGQPEEVITPAQIENIFGVHAEVEIRTSTGQLHIVFMRVAGRLDEDSTCITSQM